MAFRDGQKGLVDVRLAEVKDLKGEGFMVSGSGGREGDNSRK